MAVTPWLGTNGPGVGAPPFTYPFSDPIFQSFQVQQYLTQTGVSAVTTYTEKAPEKEAPVEEKTERKAGK